MRQAVYLDYNATTPVDPRVLEVMLPYFRARFGNPASKSHAFGLEADQAVEAARQQVASLINASGTEIIWTSGATESDNIATKGLARTYRDKGQHIITQATEHKAILDPCQYLEQDGFDVTRLGVDRTGRIDVDQLRDAIRDDTILVSVMYANNEIGTVQPIADVGGLCKEKGVIFHTDAAQAFGKLPIDVERMGIDLLSCSAHKIYGPKGVGALYVRRKGPRVRCEAVIHGGGHEKNMRSGTLNVPAIVGFGKAAELAGSELDTESARQGRLRDQLWEGLSSTLDEVYLNGNPRDCLPNTLNIAFAYVEADAVMKGCPDLAVSSGSACSSASLEPSYVLKAMGIRDELAQGSIRFSLGRFTTGAEIEQTIDQVCAAVKRLRETNPLYQMAKQGMGSRAGQRSG